MALERPKWLRKIRRERETMMMMTAAVATGSDRELWDFDWLNVYCLVCVEDGYVYINGDVLIVETWGITLSCTLRKNTSMSLMHVKLDP